MLFCSVIEQQQQQQKKKTMNKMEKKSEQAARLVAEHYDGADVFVAASRFCAKKKKEKALLSTFT